MDPTATFAEMVLAFDTGHNHAAVEHASNLQEWLRRGGLMPQIEPAMFRTLLRYLKESADLSDSDPAE